MTYHLDVDSELRFEVEHGAEVQLEVILVCNSVVTASETDIETADFF